MAEMPADEAPPAAEEESNSGERPSAFEFADRLAAVDCHEIFGHVSGRQEGVRGR
jgi:hypothetical protein